MYRERRRLRPHRGRRARSTRWTNRPGTTDDVGAGWEAFNVGRDVADRHFLDEGTVPARYCGPQQPDEIQGSIADDFEAGIRCRYAELLADAELVNRFDRVLHDLDEDDERLGTVYLVGYFLGFEVFGPDAKYNPMAQVDATAGPGARAWRAGVADGCADVRAV